MFHEHGKKIIEKANKKLLHFEINKNVIKITT